MTEASRDGNQAKELNNLSFSKALRTVVSEISATKMILDIEMENLVKLITTQSKEFTDFMSLYSVEEKDGDSPQKFRLDIMNIHRFSELVERLHLTVLSPAIMSNAMFVSLLYRWDSYFCDILRIIYQVKPEAIDSSDKSISFSTLSRFSSIQDARDYIVNAEIESLMRESHEKHLTYIENKIGVTIPKDNRLSKAFFEICERRNLIVHTNGLVSNQYINVCSKHDIIHQFSVGEKIDIDRKYISESSDNLTEFSIALGYSVWHKIRKSEQKERDSEFISLTYGFIRNERYILTQRLIEKFLEDKRNVGSEATRKMCIINLAQSYKWSGDSVKAAEVLRRENWSSSRDNFLLARAVVLENYTEAGELMTRIGVAGDVTRNDYDEWPLFQKFRETDIYRTTYKNLFGEATTIARIETVKVKSVEGDKLNGASPDIIGGSGE